MSRVLGFLARVKSIVGRDARALHDDEEMRFHLEMETEKHVRRGMPPEDARRHALASFGGLERHKDALRDGRSIPVFDMLWTDVRFGLRSLRRDAAFTTVAVITLAVGIGMATTMFSVFNGIALRDGQVRDADRLNVIWLAPADRQAEHRPLRYEELQAYARFTKAHERVAGVIFQGAVGVVLTDGARTLPVAATWVTGDFCAVLGVTPVLGRALLPSDDAVGAAPVLVISHTLWQERFGGTASVIGKRLELNATTYTVVGVMPRGFDFPRKADLWMPVLSTYPLTRESGRFGPDVMEFDAVARLRPNVDRRAAASEMLSFQRQSDPRRPAMLRGAEPIVMSFMDRVVGGVRGTLVAASVAVGLLLLIACVNVANLLVIRGGLRTQELAIRSALGAGRATLVRQLLTEASLLAIVGGLLAVALSLVAVHAVRVLAPADVPHRELIEVDSRVLLVTLATTVFATVVSGLLPAVLAARGDLGIWLRGGRAMSGVHRHTARLRQALVAGQIALAVVVLISAGLITRSLFALQDVDMGFNDQRLMIVETLRPPDAQRSHAADLNALDLVRERISTIRGVTGVAALTKPPYAAEGGWTALFSALGQSEDERVGNPAVGLEVVSDRYFETLEIPMSAGRTFTAGDREGAQAVAIISGELARLRWAGGNAIGKQIKLGSPENPSPWMTVIGVAAETRYRELASARPTIYLPSRQFGGPVPMTFAVRVREGGVDVRPALRNAFADAVPDLRVVTEASMLERRSAPLARPRFGAMLFLTFAVVTLLLSGIGIYGAIAALVRERQPEFGIRLALGEEASSIRSRILRIGATVTTVGIAIGIGVALLVAKSIQPLLFGVGARDPVTIALAATVVCLAAAIACWLPAVRASRINPIDVLRASSS